LLDRGIKFILTAAGDENVGPFGDKLPCRSQTDTAVAPGYDRDFSVQFSHDYSCGRGLGL
jgi:hypothetical protein